MLRSPRATSAPTPDAFLAGYALETHAIAQKLRRLVKQGVPGVVEAVYPGWRLMTLRVSAKRYWLSRA